jgi:acyl carrier protein
VDLRQRIMELVEAHLPRSEHLDSNVRDETTLAELGVNSMWILSLFMTLQDEYTFEMEQLVGQGMPVTIGGLVALLETGISASG